MALYCPQGSGTLHQQLLMMHVIAWYCMVLHGIAWFYIILHCLAWYCMVLHGIAWHFWGSPNGKVVAPGILVICPVDKNYDCHTKNWLLAPNIQIFGSKKHIFAPSSQLKPHWSMFSTQKRCLIGFLIWGYQKVYSLPPKNGFLAQKWPNMTQNWHFWPNRSIFGQIWPFLAK